MLSPMLLGKAIANALSSAPIQEQHGKVYKWPLSSVRARSVNVTRVSPRKCCVLRQVEQQESSMTSC